MNVHASSELVGNINIGIQHSDAFNFRLFPTKNKYACTKCAFAAPNSCCALNMGTCQDAINLNSNEQHHCEYVEFHTFPMSLLEHFNILRDVNQTQPSIYCLSPCGMATLRIDLNLSFDWNLFLFCCRLLDIHSIDIRIQFGRAMPFRECANKSKRHLQWMCIARNDTSKWIHLYSVHLCQIILLHNTQCVYITIYFVHVKCIGDCQRWCYRTKHTHGESIADKAIMKI